MVTEFDDSIFEDSILTMDPDDILGELDLEPIIRKALDKKNGVFRCKPFVEAIAHEYRRFLWLCCMYPDLPVVSSGMINEIWRLHAEETEKYAEDCEQCFGRFLPYVPHIELHGRSDRALLVCKLRETLNLYRAHFGQPPEVIWRWGRAALN